MVSRDSYEIESLTQKQPDGLKPALLNAAACPREHLSRRRNTRTQRSALRGREVSRVGARTAESAGPGRSRRRGMVVRLLTSSWNPDLIPFRSRCKTFQFVAC